MSALVKGIIHAMLIMVALSINSSGVYAHGVKSSSATVEILPNRLVNLKVQFHLLDFLHHSPESGVLTLPAVASMPEHMFVSLYQSVLADFDDNLQVSLGEEPAVLNLRLPSPRQAHGLLKREFVESKYAGQGSPPYTFDDRRFYQIFNYDFRLTPEQNIDDLHIRFPSKLGKIYVSFVSPQTRDVTPGEIWSFEERAAKRLD